MRIWSKYLTTLQYKLRYLTPYLKSDCLKILCYGDSNTWGYIPGDGSRFGANVRWPGVLQNRLGSGAIVFEEGLCGRTTIWEDPTASGRNGCRTLLPIMKHYAPLDFIVFSLGANDLKARFDQPAISIAEGAKLLCQKAQNTDSGRSGAAPDILLMAPPPITKLTSAVRVEFEGAEHKSKLLAEHFSDIAQKLDIHFIDTADFITPNSNDPIHWDASAHQIIGQIVGDRVKQIFR